MAMLEWGARKVTLPAGEVVAGSDAACAIAVTGARVLPRHAVFTAQPDGQVVIHKAVPEADVLINGVRLGGEPTPLLHGDKVDLGGVELTFVDERRSGSTQYIQAMPVPGVMAEAKGEARPGTPTANTGGRLVSLTDGREYAIAGKSLVFGREAGCDVVVTGKDVSRRHAEILATAKGYLLVDHSTNGTFVNDQRLEGQRLLARADVIRIGEETFRFYADPAFAAPPPAAPAGGLPSVPPLTPAAPPLPPPPGAGQRLQNTSFGIPHVKRAPPADAASPGATTIPTTPGGAPPAAAILATFLVRAGALKGQRMAVRTPVVNIGRAEYNDIVFPDESVSTAHAKLQRREGVWVLVDLESTNGTFVDGERVEGEAPLAPAAVVRFGDVSLLFEPTEADDALGVAKGGGTKVIQALKVPAAPAAPAPPPAAPKPAPAPAAPAPRPPRAPAPRPPKAPAPRSPKAQAHRPPAGQAPAEPAKKGKGCGAGVVLLLVGTALATWVLG